MNKSYRNHKGSIKSMYRKYIYIERIYEVYREYIESMQKVYRKYEQKLYGRYKGSIQKV